MTDSGTLEPGRKRERSEKAVNPLIACLEDGEDEVRWEAADALVEIGRPAMESLLRMVDRGSGLAKSEAIGVLGRLGDSQAIGPIIENLRDDDKRVRWAASKALAEMGEPAVAYLIDAIDDPNLSIRKRALEALVEIGGPAIGPLVGALDDQRIRVRWGALEAVERFGPEAVEPRIQALESGSGAGTLEGGGSPGRDRRRQGG